MSPCGFLTFAEYSNFWKKPQIYYSPYMPSRNSPGPFMTYYSKLPENISDSIVMVLDPMLATGGSSSDAIKVLKDLGAKSIKLVCIIGAPEGIKRISSDHPDVQIYIAGVDEKLNKNGDIVPGLGDAGDRLFGTK